MSKLSSLCCSMSFFLLGILTYASAQEQNGEFKHELPEGVELVDPKSLGLSDADLSKFLGNVKVLGGGTIGDTKTQILTVGFEGDENINFNDFEIPGLTDGNKTNLPDKDKEIADMAFKKFKQFFEDPKKAKQFENENNPNNINLPFPPQKNHDQHKHGLQIPHNAHPNHQQQRPHPHLRIPMIHKPYTTPRPQFLQVTTHHPPHYLHLTPPPPPPPPPPPSSQHHQQRQQIPPPFLQNQHSAPPPHHPHMFNAQIKSLPTNLEFGARIPLAPNNAPRPPPPPPQQHVPHHLQQHPPLHQQPPLNHPQPPPRHQQPPLNHQQPPPHHQQLPPPQQQPLAHFQQSPPQHLNQPPPQHQFQHQQPQPQGRFQFPRPQQEQQQQHHHRLTVPPQHQQQNFQRPPQHQDPIHQPSHPPNIQQQYQPRPQTSPSPNRPPQKSPPAHNPPTRPLPSPHKEDEQQPTSREQGRIVRNQLLNFNIENENSNYNNQPQLRPPPPPGSYQSATNQIQVNSQPPSAAATATSHVYIQHGPKATASNIQHTPFHSNFQPPTRFAKDFTPIPAQITTGRPQSFVVTPSMPLIPLSTNENAITDPTRMLQLRMYQQQKARAQAQAQAQASNTQPSQTVLPQQSPTAPTTTPISITTSFPETVNEDPHLVSMNYQPQQQSFDNSNDNAGNQLGESDIFPKSPFGLQTQPQQHQLHLLQFQQSHNTPHNHQQHQTQPATVFYTQEHRRPPRQGTGIPPPRFQFHVAHDLGQPPRFHMNPDPKNLLNSIRRKRGYRRLSNFFNRMFRWESRQH